ncbi:hypothetical protein [Streptomyces sp. NPDC050560]|uniref:hypothetical protein n=1 Tax=Streptomyces sp. NPDC050560 TaxID=3365630 RepID=UPI0037892A6A
MRGESAVRAAVAATACGALLVSLAACGGGGGGAHPDASGKNHSRTAARAPGRHGLPGVGTRLLGRLPADSRQVVAVYGDGNDSARSTVDFYTRRGSAWEKGGTWSAHNGKKGWTTDHHEDDDRSPVGVFTLSDAGGVLPDPGARLPYTASASFQAPGYWGPAYRHDFDYVIAIDYNRVKGAPPNDPRRPQGESKGGSIWLHMDHGSGTSACVSLPESGMKFLLRALDPKLHPVVVMGDRADLRA